MTEITPSLCVHLQHDANLLYAGLDIDGSPHFLCPGCYADKAAELLRTKTPAIVRDLTYVEAEHATAINRELTNRAMSVKATDRHVARRLNNLREYLNPRRYGFPVDNWKPRYIGPACLVEEKSLSSYSDVVVVNRRETYDSL